MYKGTILWVNKISGIEALGYEQKKKKMRLKKQQEAERQNRKLSWRQRYDIVGKAFATNMGVVPDFISSTEYAFPKHCKEAKSRP